MASVTAVKVAEAPAQMVAEFTFTAGKGITVTIWVAVEEQPFASNTVTEYVPEELTVMEGVVSLVDHA